MKKKLAALSVVLCLTLTGCGEKISNEYGENVYKVGPYIEISHTNGKSVGGSRATFLIAYHENTKVVYEIVTVNDTCGGISIRELYAYDEEGHPIVQFYEDGKIVTKGVNK